MSVKIVAIEGERKLTLQMFWMGIATPTRAAMGICWQSRPIAPSRTSLKARPRPARAS